MVTGDDPRTAAPRCINWQLLGKGKKPKYCANAFCPLHGCDERARRCRHLVKQLPQDMDFYSWIVHVNTPLANGNEPHEVGQVFDALRRALKRNDPAVRVFSLTHWHYGRVHLHVLLFVSPGFVPIKKELAACVRETLRKRARDIDPERRDIIAKRLNFKDLWPASKQPAEVALRYACKTKQRLEAINLAPLHVKGVRFCHGFKKIPSAYRKTSRVKKEKSCNASPSVNTATTLPPTEETPNDKLTATVPNRTEPSKRPHTSAGDMTAKPYNKGTAAPRNEQADDASFLAGCPVNEPNLSSFIWSVADLLRGDYKQSEYGKVILPFTVLRRLDCVLEPTKEAVLAELAKRTQAKLNPEPFLLKKAGQLFYNTSPLDMKRLVGDQDHVQENTLAYIEGFSAAVRDIFASFEFDKQIDRLAKAGLLYLVAEKFATIDLHPETVSNAQMGTVFEELIRKFAELSNETAGEHFTPREVIRLMVNLIFAEDDDDLTKPGVVRSLYDPTAGTGGMLSVAGEHLAEMNPGARLVMYGQELNAESYAICKADMLIKGQDIANIIFGNTLSADGLPGKTFDYMLSNPPFGVEWKKIQKEIKKEHEQLGDTGRFGPGLPRVSDGSLLFLLHLLSKMQPAKDGGSRFGIVLNGSPLFTGGAGSGESEIRRYVLENDRKFSSI